jgi:hypothetical protein
MTLGVTATGITLMIRWIRFSKNHPGDWVSVPFLITDRDLAERVRAQADDAGESGGEVGVAQVVPLTA